MRWLEILTYLVFTYLPLCDGYIHICYLYFFILIFVIACVIIALITEPLPLFPMSIIALFYAGAAPCNCFTKSIHSFITSSFQKQHNIIFNPLD